MTSSVVLSLITLLGTKHFVVDFLLQNKYQYENKGTYGHLGGLLHAALHGIATAGCVFVFNSLTLSIALGLLDSIIHYHIDWLKVKVTKKKNWTANTHDQFWYLLGFDQYLHFLTYMLIVKLTM